VKTIFTLTLILFFSNKSLADKMSTFDPSNGCNAYFNIIYDNCILYKSKGATAYQIPTIKKICKEKACNPSMWDKLLFNR